MSGKIGTVSAGHDYTSPDLARSALVLIDVQNDFVSGPSQVDGTAERMPEMARLLAAFRAAHRPIVHIVRLYVPGGSDADPPRRAAIEAGRFHIWAADSVEEGIELLTGVPAGVADNHAHYPEGSVFAAVEARLKRFHEAMREFGRSRQ